MNNFEAALPLLSAENRLRQLQFELGISAAFVAALGKIQPTTLSNAYRGVKSLDNETAKELLTTLRYISDISDSLRPWFALPLKNAEETRTMVHSMQKAGITAEKVREAISNLMAGQ